MGLPKRLTEMQKRFCQYLVFGGPDGPVNKMEAAEPEYIFTPSSWNHETNHPASGYATFRLQILGLKQDKIYSIYLPEMISNYRLWIDGTESSGNGQVANTAEDSKPQFLPRTLSFQAESNRVEIIIHISNFNILSRGSQ